MISWTWSIPVPIIAVLAGTLLTTAVRFLTNAIAFCEPSAQSAFPTLVALMRDSAKFPLDIYGTGTRILTTFLLPYALISYNLSRLVLGIRHPAMWWAATPLIAAAAAVTAATVVWRRGINRYQGVGH